MGGDLGVVLTTDLLVDYDTDGSTPSALTSNSRTIGLGVEINMDTNIIANSQRLSA